MHSWRVSPEKALDIQRRLQREIRVRPLLRPIQSVAGVDVCYSETNRRAIWGAIALFTYPELTRVETKWAKGKLSFPNIPGLLGFREIPILLKALRKMSTPPDLILCDGQGIAHPRGFGLASHLGYVLDTPSIGCAKSRFVGEWGAVAEERGSFTSLWYRGHRVGRNVLDLVSVKGKGYPEVKR